MTIPAWVRGTTYFTGERVRSGSLYFEEMFGVSCVSAATGYGPKALGSLIVDGTCLWNSVSAAPTGGAPTITAGMQWTRSTAYLAGGVIVTHAGSGSSARGYFYAAASACISASSGIGPTGPAPRAEGTCDWKLIYTLPTAIYSNKGPNSYIWDGGNGNLTPFVSLNGGTAWDQPGTGYVEIKGPTVIGSQTASPGRYEFGTTSPIIVVRTYALKDYKQGYGIRVVVCGSNHDHCQYVSPNIVGPNVSGWARYVIDFTNAGGRVPRDIIIETVDAMGGVDIFTGDEFYLPTNRPTLTLGSVGDSYPAGGGVVNPMWAYPKITADLLGIRGFVHTAIGGCGYGATVCASGSAIGRVSDVFQINNGKGPDILMISNGTNDLGSSSALQIAADQSAYIQAIRANSSTTDSLIVVLGIYAHNGGGTACRACVAADIAEKEAVDALNDPLVVYCPWVNDPKGSWETGTGSISSQNGSGNGDFMFETIGQHSNAFGNRNFAERAANCVRRWLSRNGK